MHQRKHFPLSALEALSIIDTAFVDNKKMNPKESHCGTDAEVNAERKE